MTNQHATQLIAQALQGDCENPVIVRAAGFYANALTGLARLVLRDPESFFDEVLGDEADQARGEALDQMSIFRKR